MHKFNIICMHMAHATFNHHHLPYAQTILCCHIGKVKPEHVATYAATLLHIFHSLQNSALHLSSSGGRRGTWSQNRTPAFRGHPHPSKGKTRSEQILTFDL